ncbi:conserved hypothetical protein [Candidatus Sulfotelmatomonas gaucii]|uniref:Glycosyl transferase family 2 n=1 Tax=Candidatus Sulfuritelmatomonas gaucii TaxID=2043161 RepID=A0A2N9M935_9BACT|nr:conserved hypothetical protein [Candidatus Sulfotelmatomonas gaucii]
MATQQLWAITCFYNPLGCESRLRNYQIFRENLSLPLVTVEWSHEGRFQLRQNDADILLQIGTGDLLWQKERLLNIALRSVPTDCHLIAWLDSDVVFEDSNWTGKTVDLLRKFMIVEPFSQVYEVPRGGMPGDAGSRRARGYGLLYALSEGIAPPEVLRGDMRVNARTSCGLAWAARREILDQFGFYDACVLGSGNRAIACAMLGRFCDAIDYMQMGPRWARHYMNWAQPYFEVVQGSVGFAEGGLFHLWHGELENRRYSQRHKFLGSRNFDPGKEIWLDDRGTWRWNGMKSEAEQYVRGYFEARREDG